MNQSDRTTEPQTLLSEQILQSARERAERLLPMWEMSVEQRVQAMREGELSLEQCAAWAARYPEQVPLLNGEFEYLAVFTPEVRE
jgi:hypothetical protein